MKRIFLSIFLITPFIWGQSSETGRLIVKVPQTGLQVFLNDSLVPASDEGYEMQPQEVEIKALNPDRVSARYPDFVKQVRVRAGETTTVDVFFRTLHRFETTPSGCQVFEGDRLIGTTPMEIDLTDHISTRWRIEKLGYEPFFLSLEQARLDTPLISAVLKPVTPNAVVRDNVFATAEWEQEGYRKNGRAILTVGIAGLGSGFIAAYYKSKADKAFENAKLARRSGNQVAKQRYLNRASKYDRYAAISYIGMQINVGALFYFLFQSN